MSIYNRLVITVRHRQVNGIESLMERVERLMIAIVDFGSLRGFAKTSSNVFKIKFLIFYVSLQGAVNSQSKQSVQSFLLIKKIIKQFSLQCI